ncbi:MAG TPA: hypothetical protein VKA53_10790, partial [Thermoanaerobaculia bacterium]|nr:hypothetical protein [Thermoanaerobaculia bacterium]
PTLELVVEAAAFSDLNPYSLRDARTQFAVSLQNGSTQYNEFSLSASKAQILDVAEDADGASALWHMTLGLYPSSYTTADQFSIVFD